MFRGASEGKEKRQTEPLAVGLHNSGPGLPGRWVPMRESLTRF
jgi:hypothetical protein